MGKDYEVLTNKSSWDKKVHAALWAYRCTPNSSTGYTPFRLVYGIESLLPIAYDVATIQTTSSDRMDTKDSLSSHLLDLSYLDEDCQHAKDKILLAQMKQKKYFDAKIKIKEFKVGDLVKEFDARHERRVGKKFLPRWFGPFHVKKAHYDNNTYELEELDGTPSHWVNKDKLSLFHVCDEVWR